MNYRYLLIFLFLTLSLQAFARSSGIMLRPAGSYWTQEQKTGDTIPTTTTTTNFIGILGLGFRMDSGLYIGGTYFYFQEDVKVENITLTETKQTYTAYGPTLGYVGSNFYLLGTYHLAPTYVVGTSALKDTYFGGTGYQVDLGYMFWVSGSIGIGPQFTYYRAEYKRIKNTAGIESDLANTATSTEIRPILALSFIF